VEAKWICGLKIWWNEKYKRIHILDFGRIGGCGRERLQHKLARFFLNSKQKDSIEKMVDGFRNFDGGESDLSGETFGGEIFRIGR